MPGKKRGHRHMSAREHEVFNEVSASYTKRGKKPPAEGHLWAIVEGMSPKTLRRPGNRFKTTPRTYSITHAKAAAARHSKALRLGLKIGR